MEIEIYEKKFENKDLNFLKYSILAYSLTDIIGLMELVSVIRYLDIIIVLTFNALLLINIIVFYKKYPNSIPDIKLLILPIALFIILVISTLKSIIQPSIKLETTLSTQVIASSSGFSIDFYFTEVILILSTLLWIFFAYYFTKFINNNFSGSKDKINVFFYASLIQGVSNLLSAYGYYKLILVLENAKQFGITTTNTIDYNNVINILVLGYIIQLIYMIEEIIACWIIYRRIDSVSKGKYRPKSPYNSDSGSYSNSSINIKALFPELKQNDTFYCPYCGMKLSSESRFCDSCGEQVTFQK